MDRYVKLREMLSCAVRMRDMTCGSIQLLMCEDIISKLNGDLPFDVLV